jgi:hypothetical protein
MVVQNVPFSLFENNIFCFPGINNYGSWVSPIGGANNCIIKNNLLVNEPSFPIGTTNIYSNNIIVSSSDSIFINQSGVIFNYLHDYHLKYTCPAKNAGSDGTDIGIYGGAFPWKEGSIPSNPHIQFKSIAPKTTNQNTLPIQIKVKAQDN